MPTSNKKDSAQRIQELTEKGSRAAYVAVAEAFEAQNSLEKKKSLLKDLQRELQLTNSALREELFKTQHKQLFGASVGEGGAAAAAIPWAGRDKEKVQSGKGAVEGERISTRSGRTLEEGGGTVSDDYSSNCEVCGSAGDVYDFMCCDTCSLVFHFACHMPQISEIPDGAWSCSYCVYDGLLLRSKGWTASALVRSPERTIGAGLPTAEDTHTIERLIKKMESNKAQYEKRSPVKLRHWFRFRGVLKVGVEENCFQAQYQCSNDSRRLVDLGLFQTAEDAAKKADELMIALNPQVLQNNRYMVNFPPGGHSKKEARKRLALGLEANLKDGLPRLAGDETETDSGSETETDYGSVEGTDEEGVCPLCLDDDGIACCLHCGCQLCGSKGDANKFVLCWDCDDPYHMYCLSPPLQKKPTSHWNCMVCEERRAIRERMTSQKTPTLPTASKEKGKGKDKTAGGLDKDKDKKAPPIKFSTRANVSCIHCRKLHKCCDKILPLCGRCLKVNKGGCVYPEKGLLGLTLPPETLREARMDIKEKATDEQASQSMKPLRDTKAQDSKKILSRSDIPKERQAEWDDLSMILKDQIRAQRRGEPDSHLSCSACAGGHRHSSCDRKLPMCSTCLEKNFTCRYRTFKHLYNAGVAKQQEDSSPKPPSTKLGLDAALATDDQKCVTRGSLNVLSERERRRLEREKDRQKIELWGKDQEKKRDRSVSVTKPPARLSDGISKEQPPRKREREDSVGSEQSILPKPKRGRPRKEGEKVKPLEEKVKPLEEKIKPPEEKRGRGRPRKYPRPQEHTVPIPSEGASSEQASDDLDQKGKKGLPRQDSSSSIASQASQERKGRGRPRKDSMSSSASMDSVKLLPKVEAELEPDQNKTSVTDVKLSIKPRGRGRRLSKLDSVHPLGEESHGDFAGEGTMEGMLWGEFFSVLKLHGWHYDYGTGIYSTFYMRPGVHKSDVSKLIEGTHYFVTEEGVRRFIEACLEAESDEWKTKVNVAEEKEKIARQRTMETEKVSEEEEEAENLDEKAEVQKSQRDSQPLINMAPEEEQNLDQKAEIQESQSNSQPQNNLVAEQPQDDDGPEASAEIDDVKEKMEDEFQVLKSGMEVDNSKDEEVTFQKTEDKSHVLKSGMEVDDVKDGEIIEDGSQLLKSEMKIDDGQNEDIGKAQQSPIKDAIESASKEDDLEEKSQCIEMMDEAPAESPSAKEEDDLEEKSQCIEMMDDAPAEIPSAKEEDQDMEQQMGAASFGPTPDDSETLFSMHGAEGEILQQGMREKTDNDTASETASDTTSETGSEFELKRAEGVLASPLKNPAKRCDKCNRYFKKKSARLVHWKFCRHGEKNDGNHDELKIAGVEASPRKALESQASPKKAWQSQPSPRKDPDRRCDKCNRYFKKKSARDIHWKFCTNDLKDSRKQDDPKNEDPTFDATKNQAKYGHRLETIMEKGLEPPREEQHPIVLESKPEDKVETKPCARDSHEEESNLSPGPKIEPDTQIHQVSQDSSKRTSPGGSADSSKFEVKVEQLLTPGAAENLEAAQEKDGQDVFDDSSLGDDEVHNLQTVQEEDPQKILASKAAPKEALSDQELDILEKRKLSRKEQMRELHPELFPKTEKDGTQGNAASKEHKSPEQLPRVDEDAVEADMSQKEATADQEGEAVMQKERDEALLLEIPKQFEQDPSPVAVPKEAREIPDEIAGEKNEQVQSFEAAPNEGDNEASNEAAEETTKPQLPQASETEKKVAIAQMDKQEPEEIPTPELPETEKEKAFTHVEKEETENNQTPALSHTEEQEALTKEEKEETENNQTPALSHKEEQEALAKEEKEETENNQTPALLHTEEQDALAKEEKEKTEKPQIPEVISKTEQQGTCALVEGEKTDRAQIPEVISNSEKQGTCALVEGEKIEMLQNVEVHLKTEEQNSLAAKEIEAPERKGRGRPRKYPLQSTISEVGSSAVSKEKEHIHAQKDSSNKINAKEKDKQEDSEQPKQDADQKVDLETDRTCGKCGKVFKTVAARISHWKFCDSNAAIKEVSSEEVKQKEPQRTLRTRSKQAETNEKMSEESEQKEQHRSLRSRNKQTGTNEEISVGESEKKEQSRTLRTRNKQAKTSEELPPEETEQKEQHRTLRTRNKQTEKNEEVEDKSQDQPRTLRSRDKPQTQSKEMKKDHVELKETPRTLRTRSKPQSEADQTKEESTTPGKSTLRMGGEIAEQLSCEKCNKVFKNKAGLNGHLRTSVKCQPTEEMEKEEEGSWEQDSDIKCDVCGRIFKKKSDLFTHWKSCKQEETKPQKEEVVDEEGLPDKDPEKRCHKCHRFFKKKSARISHSKFCTGKHEVAEVSSPLKDPNKRCDKCGKIFKKKSARLIHWKYCTPGLQDSDNEDVKDKSIAKQTAQKEATLKIKVPEEDSKPVEATQMMMTRYRGSRTPPTTRVDYSERLRRSPKPASAPAKLKTSQEAQPINDKSIKSSALTIKPNLRGLATESLSKAADTQCLKSDSPIEPSKLEDTFSQTDQRAPLKSSISFSKITKTLKVQIPEISQPTSKDIVVASSEDSKLPQTKDVEIKTHDPLSLIIKAVPSRSVSNSSGEENEDLKIYPKMVVTDKDGFENKTEVQISQSCSNIIQTVVQKTDTSDTDHSPPNQPKMQLEEKTAIKIDDSKPANKSSTTLKPVETPKPEMVPAPSEGREVDYDEGEKSPGVRTRGSKRPRSYVSLKESDMAKGVLEQSQVFKKPRISAEVKDKTDKADSKPETGAEEERLQSSSKPEVTLPKAQAPQEPKATRRKSARLSRAPKKYDDSALFLDKEDADSSTIKMDSETSEDNKKRHSSRLQKGDGERNVDGMEEENKEDPRTEEGDSSSPTQPSEKGSKAATSPLVPPLVSTRASARERRPKKVWSPDDQPQVETSAMRKRSAQTELSILMESEAETEQAISDHEKDAENDKDEVQSAAKKVKFSEKDSTTEAEHQDSSTRGIKSFSYTPRRGRYDVEKVVMLVEQMKQRLLDETELHILDTVSRSGNIAHIQAVREALLKQKAVLVNLCSSRKLKL